MLGVSIPITFPRSQWHELITVLDADEYTNPGERPDYHDTVRFVIEVVSRAITIDKQIYGQYDRQLMINFPLFYAEIVGEMFEEIRSRADWIRENRADRLLQA